MQKKLIVWQAHECNLSGANIAMLEYIDAMREQYQFHVLLPHEGNMRKELTKRAIPLTVIPQYNWSGMIPFTDIVNHIKQFVRTRLALKAIKQVLKELNPYIVFTNTLVPFVAAKAAFELNLPHVWWIHEYGEEDFGFRIGNGKPEKAYKLMQKWSKLVICNSDAVTNKFKALLPTVSVRRVYQPVSWNINRQAPVVKESSYLMFGQITPSKGHMEVLEAIAATAKEGIVVQLSIKGPCENTAYLDRLHVFITQNELTQQVKIEKGFFVKEMEMPKHDVLIVASQSEAFGRVIIEANKAGLKVIVKNSGGAPELVNETNGLTYQTTEELCEIFSGKKVMPAAPIRLNYNEHTELHRLHNLLASI